MKMYTYANGQVLSRHDGDYSAPQYFYIHDRLSSTRQIINTSGSVVRYYTYEPFGEVLEEDGTLANYMMFTGQYYDTEIDQYYLRARQYDPHISRFTARDPIRGEFEEPLTLHRYLYCANNPVNRIDPAGLKDYTLTETQMLTNAATWLVGTDPIIGPLVAFGPFGPYFHGVFDFKAHFYVSDIDTFRISSSDRALGCTQFSNYLAGYTTYYNYGLVGEMRSRMVGVKYAYDEYWDGQSSRPVAEEIGSQFWITKGAIDANIQRRSLTGMPIGMSMFSGGLLNQPFNRYAGMLDYYRLRIMLELLRTTAYFMDFNLDED